MDKNSDAVPQRLAGRRAAVTGGGRGIGEVIAARLAAEGAHVAILDVLEQAPATAERIAAQHGVRTCSVRCDVTDEAGVDAAFDQVEEQFGGPVDVLVTAAGIAHNIEAHKASAEQFRRVVDVNLNGTFITASRCARRLIEAGAPGAIVTIASMSGHIVNVPQPQAAYNASKAGVIMLTKSLAYEWIPFGIRVNAVSPGYIVTEMTRGVVQSQPEMVAEWERRTPLGRLGAPEDLGPLVAFLASDEAAYLVGSDVLADGGYLLP